MSSEQLSTPLEALRAHFRDRFSDAKDIGLIKEIAEELHQVVEILIDGSEEERDASEMAELYGPVGKLTLTCAILGAPIPDQPNTTAN